MESPTKRQRCDESLLDADALRKACAILRIQLPKHKDGDTISTHVTGKIIYAVLGEPVSLVSQHVMDVLLEAASRTKPQVFTPWLCCCRALERHHDAADWVRYFAEDAFARFNVNESSQGRGTLLCLAIHNGNSLPTCRALLDAKASLSQTTTSGHAPLEVALLHEKHEDANPELVRLLLRYGPPNVSSETIKRAIQEVGFASELRHVFDKIDPQQPWCGGGGGGTYSPLDMALCAPRFKSRTNGPELRRITLMLIERCGTTPIANLAERLCYADDLEIVQNLCKYTPPAAICKLQAPQLARSFCFDSAVLLFLVEQGYIDISLCQLAWCGVRASCSLIKRLVVHAQKKDAEANPAEAPEDDETHVEALINYDREPGEFDILCALAITLERTPPATTTGSESKDTIDRRKQRNAETLESMRLLIKAGASVNVYHRRKEYASLLHILCASSDVESMSEFIAMVLDCGAKPRKNIHGKTPLMMRTPMKADAVQQRLCHREAWFFHASKDPVAYLQLVLRTQCDETETETEADKWDPMLD